jgi:hypothetical protein
LAPPNPQILDFIDCKLVKDGDHDKLAEHLFSMALKVVKDSVIFSSSKVIRAFYKTTRTRVNPRPFLHYIGSRQRDIPLK